MPKPVRHCPCLFNNCFLVGLLAGKVYKESIIRDNVAQEFPWKTRAKALRVVPKVAQVAGSWAETNRGPSPFHSVSETILPQASPSNPVLSMQLEQCLSPILTISWKPHTRTTFHVDGGEITFTQLYSRKPLRCMETCGDGKIIKLIESKVMILSYLTLLNLSFLT